MFKSIKKIAAFFSLFLLYFIIKEFLELYATINSLNVYAGYAYLFLLNLGIIFFIIFPLIKIFKLPSYPPPVTDEQGIENLIRVRLTHFSKTDKTLAARIKAGTGISQNIYDEIVLQKKVKVTLIRKKYVTGVFYSTAISQNGFLDALFVLISGVNLIREIFVIFNGRMTGKDLINILKKIYYSAAIASTEGVEYAANEISAKFLTDGVKSIPFLTKITGSFADGFVNAALLTRVALITENYCTMLYIKKERDLYPNIKTVITLSKDIFVDIAIKMNSELKKMLQDKLTGPESILAGINPFKLLASRVKPADAEVVSADQKTGEFSGILKILNIFRYNKD